MTDEQNEVELDVCPFCGKEPAVEKYCIGTRIVCLAKNVSGIINHCVYVDGVTESEARAAWNRRAETADWTTEVPTEEGYYWTLQDDFPDVVYVMHDSRIGKTVVRWLMESTYNQDIRRYVDQRTRNGKPLYWKRIPTPPLPGKEGM